MAMATTPMTSDRTGPDRPVRDVSVSIPIVRNAKEMVRSEGATSNTKGSHRFCETIAACGIARACRVSLCEKRVVRSGRLELPRVLPHSDLNTLQNP